MINYKEYEQEVYAWLKQKHKKDNSFTFSVRMKAAKGSELDYFIGTEKSKYFATTFWTLPVGYPGSSGDCINLILQYTNDKYGYNFEFNQTNAPDNAQNTSVLNLVKSLKKSPIANIGFTYVSPDNNKMFSLKTNERQNNFESIESMFLDIEKDLKIILPAVEVAINQEKKNNPEFIAHRITPDEFDEMQTKLEKRFQKYSNLKSISSNIDTEQKVSTELDNNKPVSLKYSASINQIFYGPPGTGKTYHSILEAAKIITQDENISYKEAQGVFNENLGGRIEFITFHQNYSYEDFIQGLRPDTELSGELSFFKSDGVFKKIADKALKNLKDSENPELAKKEFNRVFSDLIKPLNEGVIDEVEIKMKQTFFYITEVSEKSIEFRKNQGDSKHTLSIATLNKMYDLGTNDIILGGLQPYYNPILNLLLENGKEGVSKVQKQNYVIIIDEINRANISRVFGELITLIEKDKRSQGKIPITATLPSGDKFIVPSNLYIIGTMNTADKSIALLDIALRRRFEFVPMYPKYELEGDDLTINNADLLEKINNEIINRKGYDFTIGHSYFMGEDYNIEKTINNKVVPLLLEYFMNDFDEVKKILKAAELEVDGWPLKLKLND